MNAVLQIILFSVSVLFCIFILSMIRDKKLELKFALTWLLTGFSFVMLSVFPGIAKIIAKLLHIKEPVNALFLSIIFFLLLIVFTLTIALSRNANRVKSLTQEIGILKLEIDKINNKIKNS